MNPRPKVAVVGLNHGSALARSIAACDSLELAALCTRDPAKHRAVADRFGLPVFAHLDAMLSDLDLDGVVIAASTDQLVPMAKQCLRRNVNVLLEKPAGVDVSEVLSLRDAATRSTAQVVVGYYRRLACQVVALKKLLAAKTIGEVRGVSCKWVIRKPPGYFQGWKASRRLGGGCLMINLIHDLDLLHQLFGPVEFVTALSVAAQSAPDLEHFGALNMRFLNGAIGTVLFSDQSPSPYSYDHAVAAVSKFPSYPVDSHHFFGTHGSLAFPSFTVYSTDSPVSSWYDRLATSIASDANQAIDDPIARQTERFACILRGTAEPHATLDDAICNLTVVEAVRRSLERSSIERVHYPPGCLSQREPADTH